MRQLTWSEPGTKSYQAGVDRGVLYPKDGDGVPWRGLISVTDTSEGFEETGLYIDGIRQRTKVASESYSASIEAFTYPDGVLDYQDVAKHQALPVFDFSFRTTVGGDNDSYQIHLVYNATATPTQVESRSLGDTVEPGIFNWNLSTTPVEVPGFKPSSHLILSSLVAYPMVMTLLEDILYGSEVTPPRMPSIQEVMDLVEGQSILLIVDHGDGSWTATGPDEAIQMVSPTSFEITWPSTSYLTPDTYTIHSL